MMIIVSYCTNEKLQCRSGKDVRRTVGTGNGLMLVSGNELILGEGKV